MTEPLVSVHMITYNHAPFIARAIEGVLAQKTGFPFDLVIGEDCSRDETRRIALEYQSRHPGVIRVIYSDKNVGARENQYRTGGACRGKYIAYCDGDDYWIHPGKLQRQVDHMERHPECGMVFGDCDVYHQRTGRTLKRVRYSSGYRSPAKMRIEQILGAEKITLWPWTCTAMVRREFLERITEEDLYLHRSGTFLLADVQVWAEMALISDVDYIPECWATYRVQDSSATNSIDIRQKLRFWISFSEMKMYLCDKHGLPMDLRRRAESVWCDKSLQLAFLDRNARLAMDVRKRKSRFTKKEWLRFYGAKYPIVHYGLGAALRARDRFRKRPDPLV